MAGKGVSADTRHEVLSGENLAFRGTLDAGTTMNTLGKIAMGLLLLCLFGAIYMTTGVLKARSTWLKSIETKMDQIETAEKDLKSARKQFEDARNQLHWENDNWGRSWQAPNSGPSPANDGVVELSIGSNAGLSQAKSPVVYVFGADEQGKSVYIGDFQLTEVRQDSAGGKLTRPLYTGELDLWPRGEFRVREQLPHNFTATIGSLRTMVLLAEQDVAHEQRALAIQNSHITASQSILAERMNELNGNTDAPEKYGQDVKDGLVQTLRREETGRNSLIQSVDQLRRALSDQHLKLTEILEANRMNAEQLGASPGQKTPPARMASEKQKTARK